MRHCFRPRIGDYFFIKLNHYEEKKEYLIEFPSPYWGLFFYLTALALTATLGIDFPSPYWGLFFYPYLLLL